MNQKLIKYLKKRLDHLQYYNKMAPFPVYDTEYVDNIKNKIMSLENEKEINYDNEPVYACKYCKSLVVPNCYDVDDDGNEYCLKCGSVNEAVEFKNINEFLKHNKEN